MADDPKIHELESVIRALSESNKLLDFQFSQQDSRMSDISKILLEVRDAVLRLEAVEATRNYPVQINEIKSNILKLEKRVNLLEIGQVKALAQKNVMGWIVHNWGSVIALALSVYVLLTHMVNL